MKQVGRVLSLGVCVSALILGVPVSGKAAPGSADHFVQLLQNSSSPRVRAQAALSLAQVQANPQVIRALANGLHDKDTVVRRASATAMGQLGDPASLAHLYRKRMDADPGVRLQVSRSIDQLESVVRAQRIPASNAPKTASAATLPRFYVGVAMHKSPSIPLDDATLTQMNKVMSETIKRIDGVVLATPQVSQKQVQARLGNRQLAGYFLDSSVAKIENVPNGIRATVSVILRTYAGRHIRAMLRGSSTVLGGSDRVARNHAIEGALLSALDKVPGALQASDARVAGLGM